MNVKEIAEKIKEQKRNIGQKINESKTRVGNSVLNTAEQIRARKERIAQCIIDKKEFLKKKTERIRHIGNLVSPFLGAAFLVGASALSVKAGMPWGVTTLTGVLAGEQLALGATKIAKDIDAKKANNKEEQPLEV